MVLNGVSIYGVAPLAGAWIEMSFIGRRCRSGIVAPLAGAWIEIRETIMYYVQVGVAPLAGAWIEMLDD